MTETAAGRCFSVPVTVRVRECRADDLLALEWFGMFTAHREIIRCTFESQQREEALMLVADLNGFPAAQAWIDMSRKRAEGVGVLWAVRVFPVLQNLGIGARMMEVSEQALRARGFRTAEVEVEKENAGARRFYERLGYRPAGDVRLEEAYTTPDGARVRRPLDMWVLRKALEDGGDTGGTT